MSHNPELMNELESLVTLLMVYLSWSRGLGLSSSFAQSFSALSQHINTHDDARMLRPDVAPCPDFVAKGYSGHLDKILP